jgi:hypothetical protein
VPGKHSSEDGKSRQGRLKLTNEQPKNGCTGKLPNQQFSWQEGYGAFTIGLSQIQATARYISNQEKHHARISFQDEWKMILQKHGLLADESVTSAVPAGTRIFVHDLPGT